MWVIPDVSIQPVTIKQSINNTLLPNLKSYMFRLYATTIIQLHVSEVHKINLAGVAMHSTVKTTTATALRFPLDIFLKYEAW